MLKSTVLREYDIRGVVGDDFNAAHARLVGQAFGSIIARQGARAISVVHDVRLTSPDFAKATIEGLLSTGLHVINLGMGPTPMSYFSHYHLDVDATIMVTASHNPSEYNGFKMMLHKKSFWGESIQQLGQVVQARDFVIGQGTYEERSIFDAYVDYLVHDFENNYPCAQAKKVVWDPGNGATAEVVQALVKRLPGQHILINEEPDGTFPAHHPDPTVAENLRELQDMIAQYDCDMGFSFDGDGDRLGVIDDQGHILWGDQQVLFHAQEVLETHPGAIIMADVKASQVLFDELTRMGATPLMWRTGHSLIKTKMAETKAPLAGEMSGHLFFADRHYGYDDALYGAIRTLGRAASMPTPLSTWYTSIPHKVNTPEIKIPTPTQDRFALIQELQETLRHADVSFIAVDGIRCVNAKGWWLLRASNTTDALIARMEADTAEDLASLKSTLNGYLAPYGLAV